MCPTLREKLLESPVFGACTCPWVLSAGASVGSQGEGLRKTPSWLWQTEGKSNHYKIFPDPLAQQRSTPQGNDLVRASGTSQVGEMDPSHTSVLNFLIPCPRGRDNKGRRAPGFRDID